jgi:hypothetical protein
MKKKEEGINSKEISPLACIHFRTTIIILEIFICFFIPNPYKIGRKHRIIQVINFQF